MKQIDVQARIGKSGDPVSIKFNMPENLQEMVQTFGEDVVYNHVKASVTVALQSFMRSKIDPEREGGAMSVAQLQQEVNGDGTEDNPGWRPGTRQPGKTAAERVKEQLSKMDPELRKQLLAELANGANLPSSDDDTETAEDTGETEEEEEPPAPQVQQRGGRRR